LSTTLLLLLLLLLFWLLLFWLLLLVGRRESMRLGGVGESDSTGQGPLRGCPPVSMSSSTLPTSIFSSTMADCWGLTTEIVRSIVQVDPLLSS